MNGELDALREARDRARSETLKQMAQAGRNYAVAHMATNPDVIDAHIAVAMKATRRASTARQEWEAREAQIEALEEKLRAAEWEAKEIAAAQRFKAILDGHTPREIRAAA